jgi:hypothetical protein
MVDDEVLGQTLRSALADETTLLGLDLSERETILRALETAPRTWPSCARRCYRSHVWRQRDGLV